MHKSKHRWQPQTRSFEVYYTPLISVYCTLNLLLLQYNQETPYTLHTNNLYLYTRLPALLDAHTLSIQVFSSATSSISDAVYPLDPGTKPHTDYGPQLLHSITCF